MKKVLLLALVSATMTMASNKDLFNDYLKAHENFLKSCDIMKQKMIKEDLLDNKLSIQLLNECYTDIRNSEESHKRVIAKFGKDK